MEDEGDVVALEGETLQVPRVTRLETAGDVLLLRTARGEPRRPAGADFSISGCDYALAGELPRTIALNWAAEDAEHTRIDWAEVFPAVIEDARRADEFV